MKNKNKPKCQFLDRGGYACDTTFPKPQQLCAACRPHWAQSRRKAVSAIKK